MAKKKMKKLTYSGGKTAIKKKSTGMKTRRRARSHG